MDQHRLNMLARLGNLSFIGEPAEPDGGGTPPEGGSTAPDEQEQTGDDEETPEDSPEPFDSDRALRKIQKLNSEARNLRDRAQEAEKKAENADELTKANESQAAEILRLKVALKHGLPSELVGRLNGTTEEELLSDAEELMGLFASKRPPSQSPTPKSGKSRTPDSAEDGVDIDKLALDQLSS